MTAAGSSDSIAIGPARPALRHEIGHLRHAAAEGIASTALVDVEPPGDASRLDQLVEKLVQGVDVPGERWRLQPQRLEEFRDIGRGPGKAAFMTGVHCSRPSSLTSSRTLMSMRPSRTLTFVAVRDRKYSSSLSLTSRRGEGGKWSSALPKLGPNVRHSQRGTIAGSVFGDPLTDGIINFRGIRVPAGADDRMRTPSQPLALSASSCA